MAAYAALISLAQTTDPNKTLNKSLFSSNAEEKVTSINDYVNFLLLFFKEFPEKINRWECRIRDVAYKTQDILDIFVWHQIQSSHGGMHPSRAKLEDQLENVKEEIGLIAGEVMEERPAYLLSSSSPSSPPSSSSSNDAVIGLHDDIMVIKDRLCGLASNLQVIPIVGMGGIGKTTLARTVYNDQLIVDRFDFRAWVVVSQDYNPHRFRRALLESMKLLEEQFCGDEIDDFEIALKVFKNLKGRRYLIVIDDVWGTHIWDDVRYIFPDDNNGSRIMLTSRQLDVAAYPYSAVPRHEMRLMDDSQSWDLLRQKVFANGFCPPDLEDVGKEIARRCAGLPLAVVLVAGVLSPVNKTRVSWEEIAKDVTPGRDLEEILSLSYDYLPHHLRPCFLYLGGFLGDGDIRTSRLVRLWVAEGFLKHQGGCSKSLEEEAEEYLEDLVKRNLVIVTSRKSDGRIKSCSLHDMLRALCTRKAHKEKFLHVMDGHDLPLMNERRISFTRFDVDEIWGPTFRTILSFQIQNVSKLLALLGSYKLLRVLDASGVNLKRLPSEVFELYHLRYLALAGSLSIPSAISNLVNLQTLIIFPNSSMTPTLYKWKRYSVGENVVFDFYLPLEIWGMPQLRHLHLCMLHCPPYESNLLLQNLQTLLHIKDLVWNEKILHMIPNVKRLGLVYQSNKEFHLHLLAHLHQLEKLEIYGLHRFSWTGRKPTFARTLKKLSLEGGSFPWKDMTIIGSLPNLQVLKLRGFICNGETWKTAEGEFLQLNFLLIDESHLRHWITESSHFPRLKHLLLLSCRDLKEIPEGIGEIPTLELIEVDYSNESLVKSAKQINEDQQSYGNYALHVRVSHFHEKSWKMAVLRVRASMQKFKEERGGVEFLHFTEGYTYCCSGQMKHEACMIDHQQTDQYGVKVLDEALIHLDGDKVSALGEHCQKCKSTEILFILQFIKQIFFCCDLLKYYSKLLAVVECEVE